MGASLDGRREPPRGAKRWWPRVRALERRAAWLLMGLAALGGIVAAYYFGYFEIPSKIADDAPEATRSMAEGQARLAAVQALGGIVVAIGAAFTIRTLWLTREGQITDRFNEAAQLLASRNVSTRVAAIYALGRIARDSRADHPAVMTLLGEHLRQVHPAPPRRDHQPREQRSAHPSVKAVAMVLRQRRVRYDAFGEALDLSGIDWRGAGLSGATLEHAEFRGARLDGAFLRGAKLGHANLTGASLVEAKLERADLGEAILEGAHLEFARVVGANLRRARMNAATTNASTNFRGADLRGARDCVLGDAIVDADTRLP